MKRLTKVQAINRLYRYGKIRYMDHRDPELRRCA